MDPDMCRQQAEEERASAGGLSRTGAGLLVTPVAAAVLFTVEPLPPPRQVPDPILQTAPKPAGKPVPKPRHQLRTVVMGLGGIASAAGGITVSLFYQMQPAHIASTALACAVAGLWLSNLLVRTVADS